MIAKTTVAAAAMIFASVFASTAFASESAHANGSHQERHARFLEMAKAACEGKVAKESCQIATPKRVVQGVCVTHEQSEVAVCKPGHKSHRHERVKALISGAYTTAAEAHRFHPGGEIHLGTRSDRAHASHAHDFHPGGPSESSKPAQYATLDDYDFHPGGPLDKAYGVH